MPALATALSDDGVWAPDLAPDGRYLPFVEALDGGLAERISRRMGGAPLRVGQSAAVMGLASRLWPVTVVSAATHELGADPDALVVRDDDGAMTLGVRAGAAVDVRSPAELLEIVLRVLTPVVETLPLAPRMLWGNAAASLHAVPRVHAAPGLRPLVHTLLAQPPFAGELDEDVGGMARRRTCCLFYLAPGAGLCGDCVFSQRPR